MQILTHVQQNSYIIALSGSLDVEDTPTLQSAFLNALKYNPKEVMVDCEELEGISPRSLKSLISTVRSLQHNHIGVVLMSVNEKLNSLFSGVGADVFMNPIASTSIIGGGEQCDIYFRKI